MFKKLTFLLLMLIVGVTSTWAVDMTTMVGQLGLTDNSNGYYAYGTRPVQLSAGTSYVYTFKNYNKGAEGTAEYQTWAVNAWSGDNGFFLRADASGNGVTAKGNFSQTYSGNKYSDVSSTVTDWLQAYNGVDVTLTITRSTDGTTVTVSHTAELAGDYTASGSTTYAGTQTVTDITSSDDIWFAITDEYSHQIISNVLYTAADGSKTNYSGVLNHTAQYASGKNTAGNSTDAEQQQYYTDRTNSNYYGGWAYADFNFTVPTNMTVSSANLTWSALNGSNGGSRDNIIYYLNAGTTFDYTNYGNYQSARTNITTVTWAKGTSTSEAQTATTDVTAAITALAASQSYAIFQWTGNAGGAKLYGLASVSRPILEVVSTTQAKLAYTINYKNGETTVKTVTGSEIAGKVITADRVVYDDNNVKYLTTEATLPSMTIVDGTNVLNVDVHTPKTATLKVTTKVGNDDATVATTNLVEADDLSCNWSYAFPLYAKNAAGTYYKTDATTFGEAGTFADGETIEKSVTYATEASDVYYFAEGESSTAVAGTNYAYSNGQEGYVAGQNARDRGISVGTLAAGNYQLVVMVTGANKRYVVLRSGTADPFASTEQTTSTGIKTVDFTLDAETSNILLNGANQGEAKTNQSENFDYVLIQKAPNKFNWTAKTNVGDVTLGSGICTEGSSVTVAYPKYINVDGTLYTKDATEKTYKVTFTPDADNYEYTAEYTATDITNVVYFSEAENIEGATATDAGSNMPGRSSNAQCAYAASDITLANLAAGNYKATVVQYSNSSTGLTLKFQAGETEYSTVTEGSSNWDEKTIEFTLTDAADFKWLTSGAEKNALDFIYIQSTATKYNYTVKSNLGTTIASGTADDGSTISYAYPQYINNNGTLYEADKASDNAWYGGSFTLDKDKDITVNYTETKTVGVVYYTEAEAISGVTTTSNYANRASNKDLAYTNTDGTDSYKEVTTLPAGTYKISARGLNGNSSDRACNFKVGDNVVFEFTITNGTNVTGTSEAFTIDKPATLSVSCTGSSKSGLDCFYVTGIESSNETVGAKDFTTAYFTTWNKVPVQIKDGETAHYKFVNYNSGTGATYENWYLFVANTSAENKTVLRADNHANIGDGTITDNDYKNVAFATDLSDATVDLYVKYEGGTLTSTAKTVKADGETELPDYIYTQTGYTDDALNVYVSVEKSWLEILEQGKTQPKAEVSSDVKVNEGTATEAQKAALDAVVKNTNVTAVENKVEEHVDAEKIGETVVSTYVQTTMTAASMTDDANITELTFDVQPVYVNTYNAVKEIDNGAITSAITFRLPLPASAPDNVVVMHEGANFGTFTVKGNDSNGNGKYIELAASSFSKYSVLTGTQSLTETRTTATGSYGTICLPYAATVEGATLLQMDGKVNNGAAIQFIVVDGNTLTAGVPYVYRATADEQKFTTKTGATYTAATTVNGFVGTYETKDISQPDAEDGVTTNLVLSENEFHPAGEYVDLPAYRCYIPKLDDVKAVGSTAKAGAVLFGLSGGATGINAINFNDVKTPVADGKYVQNGQLVIVKNGKQYNAAGQIVK